MPTPRKFHWSAADDGEGPYVLWLSPNGEGQDLDESMAVYLPKNPVLRTKAADAIAETLNRIRIPAPDLNADVGVAFPKPRLERVDDRMWVLHCPTVDISVMRGEDPGRVVVMEKSAFEALQVRLTTMRSALLGLYNAAYGCKPANFLPLAAAMEKAGPFLKGM